MPINLQLLRKLPFSQSWEQSRAPSVVDGKDYQYNQNLEKPSQALADQWKPDVQELWQYLPLN